MRIDAHQHFWKIARGDYSWMDDSVAAIRRDIGPVDLVPKLRAHDIDGTITVQAAPTVEETRYLLSLADAHDFIRGVVGWIDLTADPVPQLERLAHPAIRGIRPMLENIEDTDWILRDDVIGGLVKVAGAGLRLDALITSRHLDVIETLVHTLPDLPVVIDHCAKPTFDGTDAGERWRTGIAALARHPQVFCKLSGLANEFGEGWSADALRATYRHVLDHFGPDRLMWGSDWPVLELAGEYPTWFDVALDLTSDLSDDERTAILGHTAVRFYGLSR